MNRCPSSFSLLIGATVGLVVLGLAYGGPYGKSPKQSVIPLLPQPEVLDHRVGLQAAGGLGIKAQFLANAYMKQRYSNDRYSVPTDQLRDTDHDEFAPGVEGFYERVLGRSANSLWGARVGLGYMNIEAESDIQLRRRTLTSDLDVDMLYATLGPFYEHRFTDRFYAQISAGVAVAYMDASLHSEAGRFSDSATESDFVMGAYVSAAIGYDVVPNCSIMTGIRYQYMDRFEISNRMDSASLNSDEAYQVFVGLRWAF